MKKPFKTVGLSIRHKGALQVNTNQDKAFTGAVSTVSNEIIITHTDVSELFKFKAWLEKQVNELHEEKDDKHEPEYQACPHGEIMGECDACDHLGDIAFDVDRENRFFGRG